jgi:hypothetical protein
MTDMAEANSARRSRNQGILRRADALQRANEEIDRTFAARDDSPEGYAAWQQATRQARDAVAAMYPEAFWADVRRLAAGEHDAVEPALVFLETDPWCFRSGYVKEGLMRLLARHELTPRERERLENALLCAVDAGDRREFKRSCKLAARHKSPRLRQELSCRLLGEDPGVARRALLMLTSLPRARLTASEVDRAREIILKGPRRAWLTSSKIEMVLGGARHTDFEYWRVPSWVTELTRRFWAEAWGHQLVALALADGESREPAIAILSRAPEFELDASARSRLTELLLREVDAGEGKTFGPLTRILDTLELRAQLEQRRDGPNEEIARRAWLTLHDVLCLDANPWPQKWRADP